MSASVFADVTFTIEGADYSCSVSRAEFVNSPQILRARSLCGPTAAVGRGEWNLELEGFQDWTSATGLAAFLFNNEGEAASVEILWVDSETPTLGSNGLCEVKLIAANYGGTADEIATFSVSLPIEGTPTVTPAVVVAS